MAEVPFGFSSSEAPKTAEQIVLAKDKPAEDDKPYPDGLYL